jgi:hypothetical protein
MSAFWQLAKKIHLNYLWNFRFIIVNYRSRQKAEVCIDSIIKSAEDAWIMRSS